MDKDYFLGLLIKYIDGNATKEELHLIHSYYQLFQAEPEVLDMLSPEARNDLKEVMQKAIWERIAHAEAATTMAVRPRYGRIGTWAIAASVLLVLALASLLFYRSSSTRESIPQLIVAAKSNRVVSLPDGSIAIVASGSNLKCPDVFDKSTREVFLEGQAYFDIAHDSTRAFVVHAGKINVTVLGTAFTVKSYAEDEKVTVTVNRGKVRVADPLTTLGILYPRHQIVYNRRDRRTMTQRVDPDTCISWRTLDFVFENLTMTQVTAVLEERFKVKISVDTALASGERFTAAFVQNETLEQVLRSICEFNNAAYEYDRSKASIKIFLKKDSSVQ